jgi:hypothetical protein
MSNAFKFSIWGRPPIHREGLGACSDDHPHEVVRVLFGKPNRLVEHLDGAVFIKAPYEPDLSTTERQRVSKTEVLRQRSHTGLQASPFALADQSPSQVGIVGLLKGVRMCLKLQQGPKSIPLPDLLLPQAVVPLDGRIGGGPPLWGKNRNDPTGQTQSDQLSQTPGMHPTSCQAHVVVHLQKPRDTMSAPVLGQKGQHPLNAPIRLLASCDQTRGPILPVEDNDGTTRSQIMPHDEVDLVDVVLPFGNWTRQCRPLPGSVPTLSCQKLAPNQNPMNGPDARHRTDSQLGQLVVDRLGATESQRIPSALELAMDTTDQSLERQTDFPRNHLRSMRSILPPQLLSSLVPFRPSIHPRSASLQDAGNPTDRLPLQPESDTSFPFIDQRRSFFASYADPPWEGLYPNCHESVGSFTVTDHLSCDHSTLGARGKSR